MFSVINGLSLHVAMWCLVASKSIVAQIETTFDKWPRPILTIFIGNFTVWKRSVYRSANFTIHGGFISDQPAELTFPWWDNFSLPSCLVILPIGFLFIVAFFLCWWRLYPQNWLNMIRWQEIQKKHASRTADRAHVARSGYGQVNWKTRSYSE